MAEGVSDSGSQTWILTGSFGFVLPLCKPNINVCGLGYQIVQRHWEILASQLVLDVTSKSFTEGGHQSFFIVGEFRYHSMKLDSALSDSIIALTQTE